MSKKQLPQDLHGIVGVPGKGVQWLIGEEFVSAYEEGATVFRLWECGDKEYPYGLSRIVMAYKAWLREGKTLPWAEVVVSLHEDKLAWKSLEERSKAAQLELAEAVETVIRRAWSRTVQNYTPGLEHYGKYKGIHESTIMPDDILEKVTAYVLGLTTNIEEKYRIRKPPVDPRLARICQTYWEMEA